jgi:hypothetical protein
VKEILRLLHKVLYILQLNYDVQEIITIVGCKQEEALKEKWYAVWLLWKTTRKDALLIWEHT